MRRTRGTWVGRVCVECCVDGWWQEIFFCGCNDASARQKGFNIYSLHPSLVHVLKTMSNQTASAALELTYVLCTFSLLRMFWKYVVK